MSKRAKIDILIAVLCFLIGFIVVQIVADNKQDESETYETVNNVFVNSQLDSINSDCYMGDSERKLPESKISEEKEEAEEKIIEETEKVAYFEPQDVTEGNEGVERYISLDTSNFDAYMAEYSGTEGEIEDVIQDSGTDFVVADTVEVIDGWTYINEPYQFNSTYMGVHKITDTTSPQWAWLQSHDWSYADDCICCYDGRILVALTPIFGTIGDYVDLLLEDGTILYCIIGDEKANSDTYGHWNNGLLNVIEIIVSESWYGGHDNKYYPNVIAYR